MKILILSTTIILLASCVGVKGQKEESGPKKDGLYTVSDPNKSNDVVKEIQNNINALKNYKRQSNAESILKYNKAVRALSMRGAIAEPYIIEALAGSSDWGIRYGAINVLDSIGSKKCIKKLITAIKDEHPIIGWKALYSLRVLCEHRELPAEGEKTKENGLLPIKKRTKLQTSKEYEGTLNAWLKEHNTILHDSWKKWWDLNRRKTEIK